MPPDEIIHSEGSDDVRYRLLVEAVTDYAIYMLSPEGVITTWNPGAERFKGYTRQEIVGEHFSRFYTDEDRQTDLPRRALATADREGRFEQEGWRVRKDGTRMWAHVVIDPIRDPSNKLIGFAKVTRDISERRAAQEALRRSEERFRLLVQGVQDYAIYMLDPDGRVTNWNTGAQRFKGYTEEEIVGEHFSRFYTDEDRQSGLPSRALQTAIDEGRFEQEGWRVRKDGKRFWANVVIDAIRSTGGDLIGFAKVTRDVTDKRNAQQALEETQARFIQSQKMEVVGQLTGGIAHDFNNLLAVVLGNLDLARKHLSGDPARVKQLIENSIQAAQRGATLTQRMLAFARRQELKTAPVDIPALVRNMADLLQRSIGPEIQINTQFPLRLDPALVDANQLELALINLTVNARDAMPNGATLTIAAQADKANGVDASAYICLTVSDTGLGMDGETLARAVEPFFTTKGVGKGTGLGLSMIHGFVEQSGGRLVLKSVVGQGTAAELWLPIAKATNVRSDEPEPEAVRATSLSKRLSILVVDDDPLVLMNTAAMLEDLGHEVIEATSGEQALRAFRRTDDIDLVITDQLMPGMKGTELISVLRSERAEVPVILATGYADFEPGTDTDFVRLRKPFMQADLVSAVANSVDLVGAQVLPFRHKQG